MKASLLIAAVALCACAPAGRTPTNPAPAAPVSEIKLDDLAANAHVKSPLDVKGVAPNAWYFEAVFATRIEGVDGKVLAEAPAQAQSDWTLAGPVAFIAKLNFKVAAETRAMLVLEKDATGENKTIKTVRIPLMLEPGP